MARTDIPYKREGDENAWNKLIRDINEKVEACPGVDPLPEVGPMHRWAKSDIRAAQEKLTEVCIDNVFSDIEDLWLQRIVQELEDAAAADVCCCEEQDLVFPSLIPLEPAGFRLLDVPESGLGNEQLGWLVFDWAGWIMQTVDALVVTPIDCGEDPATEDREGGRGFVGKEYNAWELYIFSTGSPNADHFNIPLITGSVVDGYIQIGEGDPKFLNDCGEPEDDGTVPLGTNDSAWNFPYEIAEIVTDTYLISSKNNAFTSGPHDVSFFKIHGQLPIGVPSGPVSIENYEGGPPAGFLRVTCV